MTTRECFEKWAESSGWNIDRTSEGDYRTMSTDAAWGGWLECSLQHELSTLRHEALARAVMSDIGNNQLPLTQQQIDVLVNQVWINRGNEQPTPELIVRAIERAHGIGA